MTSAETKMRAAMAEIRASVEAAERANTTQGQRDALRRIEPAMWSAIYASFAIEETVCREQWAEQVRELRVGMAVESL